MIQTVRFGVLTTAVCLAAAASVSSFAAASKADPTTVPFDVPLTRATRLLVVSPHPDDAALAAAGMIQRVAEAGGVVQVVQMTSGDAFSTGVMAERRAVVPTADDYRRYGAARERETIAAMRALGVRRSKIVFLGFPDDGLCQLASQFDAHGPFESPYTKRHSPPDGEQLIRGVTYLGEDVRRELQRVIGAFGPTLVLAPDPRDEHPDHCATHMLIRGALDALAAAGRPRPAVLHYLIHYGRWPMSLAADRTLEPPATFPASDGVWRTLALTPKEAARKKQALAAYRSQLLVIGDLVAAFARRDEVFIGGEPAAPAACWCRGENIATAPPRAR